MDAEYPEMLTIPPEHAIGIENVGISDTWLLNFPDPPFDPKDKDEQRNFKRYKKNEKK